MAGGHAVADLVPLCWNFDSSWTLTYILCEYIPLAPDL